MSKRTRVLAAVLATMTITTALIGCGSSSSSSSSKTGEKQTLTIWSDLSTVEVEQVRTACEQWGNDNNVTVTVEEDKGQMQDAIAALNTSKGPDLYFGLANDKLGTYQKAGVLAEVPCGTIDLSKYTDSNVIDAVTICGKQYAVPIAEETVALFYNKDKVSTAPKTMEEVRDSGSFQFNATDFYLDYGFISAGGGYVFKNNNGTLDTTDIGLNNDGAKKGYEFLKSLIDKNLFKADITEDASKGNFISGKTNFYISGPWAIADAEKANINLGVAPLPTLNGNPMKSFLGVQAAFVSAKSTKQDLAWKLMSYLTEKTPDMLLEKGNRLPVFKSVQDSDAFKNNKYMSAFAEQAKIAVAMPNTVEMQGVWDPEAQALKSMLSGALTPGAAADKGAADAKEKIKSLQ